MLNNKLQLPFITSVSTQGGTPFLFAAKKALHTASFRKKAHAALLAQVSQHKWQPAAKPCCILHGFSLVPAVRSTSLGSRCRDAQRCPCCSQWERSALPQLPSKGKETGKEAPSDLSLPREWVKLGGICLHLGKTSWSQLSPSESQRPVVCVALEKSGLSCEWKTSVHSAVKTTLPF